MQEFVGKTLQGKYHLHRLLGEGGMGMVFEAENILIKRIVAVKIMNPALTSRPETVQRFHREAQSAALIGHKNVVDILDLGFTDEGTPFIVMEYLHGENLADIITRKGILDPRESLEILFQILSALVAAHAKGVVHRDLKPENIFVNYDPSGTIEAKILDFGISKFASSPDDTGPGLTKVGTVMGTPYYMSPEQARAEKDIDARTDIYAVGVILYQLLSGRLPFEDENYNILMARLLTETPPKPRRYRPEITVDLEKVILKAMAPDRNLRYGRTTDLLEDLMPFFKGEKECFSSVKISIIPPPEKNGEVSDAHLAVTIAAADAAPAGDAVPARAPSSLPGVTVTPTVWTEAPRRKRIISWVGTGVGLAALLVIAILMFSRGPSGEPKKEAVSAAPVPAEATLLVKGAPAGATIKLNGVPRAGTSFSLPLNSGPHYIEVDAPGFQVFKSTIPAIDKSLFEVAVSLVPLAPPPTPPFVAVPESPKPAARKAPAEVPPKTTAEPPRKSTAEPAMKKPAREAKKPSGVKRENPFD